MTTTSTATNPGYTADAAAHRRMTAVVGLATWAVATGFIVLNAHDVGEMVISSAILGVVTVGIFGWLLPRQMVTGAPGTALALSILAALLTLPAFWSGLPAVLGVAGAMLGNASVSVARRRGLAAVAVGALAVTGYLVLYVLVGLVMGDL